MPKRYLVGPGQVGLLNLNGARRSEAKRAGILSFGDWMNEGCDPVWYFTDPHLEGIFEYGGNGTQIDRVDVESRRYRTAEGLGLGATLAELQQSYGSRLKPLGAPADPYVQPWVVTTSEGSIVFNIAGNRKDDIPLNSHSGVGWMTVLPATQHEAEILNLWESVDSDPC